MNKEKNMFETKDCIIGGRENDNEKLGSIFGCENFYEIPNYQRPYNWKTEQLEELWEDLEDSFKSDKKENYYLGSIIGIKNSKKIEIVDGQQRLTTILILFYVIKKITGKNDLDKYIYYNDKDKKLRFETGNGNDGIFNNIFEREKWYSYIKQMDEIQKISTKKARKEKLKQIKKKAKEESINIYEKDGELYIEGIKNEVKQRENAKATFYNTAFFFYQVIKKFDSEKIEEFTNYILYKIHFNRIICSTKADGLEMFQVVNDRGLELSTSDIIKTYLLKEAPKGKQKAFEDDYGVIKKNLEEADVSLDEFFVVFLYYLTNKNPKRGVIKEVRKIITSNDFNEILDKLTNLSERIKKISNENNCRINCLRNLPLKQYIWAILLCERDYGYKNLDEINSAIIRYYYLNWISGATINTIKTFSFKLMGDLKKGDMNIVNNIDKELKEKGVVYTDIESGHDTFKDNNGVFLKTSNKIGLESYIKSLLMLIEYARREETIKDTNVDIKTNVYIDVNKKEVQLEHILPQKYKTNLKDWKNWKDGDNYINRLGNLTLLKDEKNLAASNKGLSEKIEIYKKEKDSYFKITKDISEKYKEKQWRKEDIDNRTNKFIELLEKQLNVKLRKNENIKKKRNE